MESSDASHQIIADLLSAHTGQQLTASRRWRVKTALADVFRERGISNVDQLACLLASPGESELTREVVEAFNCRKTFSHCWRSDVRTGANYASGARAAQPGRKSTHWLSCSPRMRGSGMAGRLRSWALISRKRRSMRRAATATASLRYSAG